MRVPKKSLNNVRILAGVTGSVSAYKSVELVRRLKDEGASVRVIMTDASKRFITPLSMELASGGKVYSDMFEDTLAHIELPRDSDVLLVAPATANMIGKFANGLADCLLSACFTAYSGKTIIVPAMNWKMYESPVVQRNLKYLKGLGIKEVPPEKGTLACGEEGTGRLASTETIIETVKAAMTPNDLAGHKVLITAGPTREYIDPVRFISNRSSGKMGYALARVAIRRGAEVTLVSGPSSLKPPAGARFISVESASDMRNAVMEELPSATAAIMAAAVADFSPTVKSGVKKGKSSIKSLELTPTPDILHEIGTMQSRPFVIGFAAETGLDIEKAMDKLKRKNADAIVLNDVTAPDSGFDVDTNRVVILHGEGKSEFPVMDKEDVAVIILDLIRGWSP